ncbi:iron complex transport system permease protein [Pseudoxanthobacter soli DSM 19599]|uniref:Iron complex transport system permease protein n=1 Tax=Pseudoxanthobacter soli DSM 19599 TaxID=1123029 RepID=A0A1M7ZRA5_9HYPH|nr:Fe(3+)-hydroxamate ABC transporter permease FhuB [Pseudoxanthobacter soli]SHO67186.1 iron complex transport system permease protein [Pseudoxanthobacter soli DSM 19599]
MAERLPLPEMRPAAHRAFLLWGMAAAVAAALSAVQVAAHWTGLAGTGPDAAGLERIILFYSVLPRVAVALVCGAALGLSGMLLQRVLHNPLAEPSTLGIAAGAQLALAAAALYAPMLMEVAREGVALAGGIAAVALVLGLTWKTGLEPVSVALAGMLTALTATSAATALILANGEYMYSLFIWGGGSLTQQSWTPTLTLGLRLALAALASALLLRPLTVLGLDDAGARGLGVSTAAIRLATVAVAVWLASSVVSEVGVIGFVGLAAPALARLSGARTPKAMLIAAPLAGAVLLWLADGMVQLLSGGGERVPTGAATALLGGPLLLWLLPRLGLFRPSSLGAQPGAVPRAARPAAMIGAVAALTLLAAIVALVVGRGPDGWTLATGPLLADLAEWRLPRTIVAAAAGALLAASGTVLQRVTANPLAGPEILGVGSGAGVGIAAALLVLPAPGLAVQALAAAAGAILVLAALLAIARRADLGPERLLLAGIAVGALCSAIITAVIATGSPAAFALLGWIGGSTNAADWSEAAAAGLASAVLILSLLPALRWLDILPLGSVAGALGVPERMSRFILIVLAGLSAAFAALFVGPLSFAGLIAPHLARLAGLTRTLPMLAGAVAIGAGLMVASDWLARMAAYPYQLPLGLFASLLAGPYLVWLLGRGGRAT